jgi:hypothetical protein
MNNGWLGINNSTGMGKVSRVQGEIQHYRIVSLSVAELHNHTATHIIPVCSKPSLPKIDRIGVQAPAYFPVAACIAVVLGIAS